VSILDHKITTTHLSNKIDLWLHKKVKYLALTKRSTVSHTHTHTYTHTFTLSNKMFNSVQVNFVKCVECGSHTISEVCNNSRVDKINQHLTQFYNQGFRFFKTVSEKVGEEYTDIHKNILGYDVFEKDEKITFLSADTLEMIVRLIKEYEEDNEYIFGVDDPEFFEALYELDRALAQQGQGEDGDGLEFRLQLIIN